MDEFRLKRIVSRYYFKMDVYVFKVQILWKGRKNWINRQFLCGTIEIIEYLYELSQI